MPDQFELAQRLDAYYRRLALEARERAKGPDQAALEYCDDCGEEIPEGRRLAAPSCTRCVNCQQQWERGHR